MNAEARILDYYDALRAGEPLSPYFATDESLVKVGISERLVGHEDVAAGLEAQTVATTDWTVESRDLRVTERDTVAWFSDAVAMAWTDRDRGRHEFDSRWSGTLERRDGDWLFVGMHVSAPHEL